MRQSKTYFEQIAVETVKKIATELPGTNATETNRVVFEMHDKGTSSQEDWRRLAQRIQEEQDPRKMLELVQQLLDVLEDRKTHKPLPTQSTNL